VTVHPAAGGRAAHPALTMRSALEDRGALLARFDAVRALTRALVTPLSAEDMQAQSMPDASPAKWHLAHTTWFFETFLCQAFEAGFEPYDRRYGHLFNSYYETVGSQWPRPQRGLLTRPPLADILAYRTRTEEAIHRLAAAAPEEAWTQIAPLLELGLHHEQQHQELICTDIKHLFSLPPAPEPAFTAAHAPAPAPADPGPASWIELPEGRIRIGHDPANGFAFDCEGPAHDRLVYGASIASRPVTNGDWLAFIEDGGYDDVRLWLSDGWAWRCETGVRSPLYWRACEDGWREYTLHGETPLDPARPVAHVSGYEAAAYAEWAGARLPSEFELEQLARSHPADAGGLVQDACVHPAAIEPGGAVQAVTGGVWEWSASAFSAYPGYRPPEGAVGEYNGKFMSSQLVLRGGSCATPQGHIRPTYRNFFPPEARWQFTGLRLVR